MGSGWSGALGTGSLSSHQASPLLYDADDDDDEDDNDEYNEEEEDSAYDAHFLQGGLHPVLEGKSVIKAACGWGHTAVIVSSDNNDDNENTLLLSGRPHDFSALLRLQRLPTFVRDMSVRISESFNENFFFKSSSGDIRQQCILPSFAPVSLPNDDVPVDVIASAGLTLIRGSSNTLYGLGVNYHGQAGSGGISNNVWSPTEILQSNNDNDNILVTDMALGLQHGLAVDESGTLYSWGKGNRGQLGHGIYQSSPEVKKVATMRTPVRHIAAGMNHSACVTEDNDAYVWGKNITMKESSSSSDNAVTDSPIPILIQGLPPQLQITDISCGSHHTSILLEDGSVYAIGIATDNTQPMLERAVQTFFPPPISNFTHPAQFASHFDRTTIVSNDGLDVREMQLWSHAELRENGDVIPECVRYLRQIQNRNVKVKLLQRGWHHSILVTD